MSERVHLGARSGFVISDLSDANDTSYIPIGVYGGYTITCDRGPLLDIDPYFEFPGLFRFAGTSKTQTDWNVVGVTVRAFVDLL